MAQDQSVQGSLDGRASADSPSSTSASFRYAPSGSYIVHIYRRRAARDRRLRHSPVRWTAGFLSTSCFAALLIGSMWMLLSFYSSENVEMGRNYSRVYSANPLFVKSISVTNLLKNEGPVVYGFSRAPELGKETDWDEAHNVVIPSNEHVEWAYWLNKGSQVTIQYNISNPDLDVLLVIIRGRENMEKWQEDITNFDLAVLWKAVQGVGSFQYKVETDQSYFFGLGNVQSSAVQVNLQFNLQYKVHNTESYTSQCCPTSSTCTVQLKLLGSDVLLLTTPQANQALDRRGGARILLQDGGWMMNVAFEQRWITYLVFCGAMAIAMLVLLVCCRPPSSNDSEASQENQEPILETTRIVNSSEEEDKQANAEHLEASSTNLLADFDDDTSELMEDYMCIICFEARRNCFFDPCGHCATCYACSMKILKEKKSLCPLCRQPIRLVRRLFLH